MKKLFFCFFLILFFSTCVFSRTLIDVNDGFEDQNMLENPVWIFSGTDYNFSDTIKNSGNYSIKLFPNTSLYFLTEKTISLDSAWDTNSEVYFYSDNPTNSAAQFEVRANGTTLCGTYLTNGDLFASTTDTNLGTIDKNTWYKIKCSTLFGSGIATVRLYKAEILLSSDTHGISAYFDTPFQIELENRNSIDSNTYFDDLNAFSLALHEKDKPTVSWWSGTLANIILDSNYWYNIYTSITIKCDDKNGSGCYKINYTIADIDTSDSANSSCYSSECGLGGNNPEGSGRFKVDFNSIDVVGNISDNNTQYFFVDFEAPTITSDVNTTYNVLGDANIHLTCTDALSDVNHIHFRIDDNSSLDLNWLPWQTYDTNLLVGSFLNKYDGNFGLQFYCSDNATNDSNTGTNYDTNYVLLDLTNPTIPHLLPQDGNYTGSINISCQGSTDNRDLNYIIDTNASGAWTRLQNSTSNNYFWDISGYSANTKAYIRCLATNGDRNSDYNTSKQIILNPVTDFNSIGNAQPNINGTTTVSTYITSVDANDSTGVKKCFVIPYKNLVAQNEQLGTRYLDTNTYQFQQTGISNGDTFYWVWHCQSNADINSAFVGTALITANIATVVPPSGGGGGGETIQNNFEVIYDKPTATLYYGKNRIAKIKFNAKNISTKTIEIATSVSGAAANYYLLDPTKKNIIEPNTTKEIEYSFLVDDDSQKIEGVIRMSNSGKNFDIPLTMIYDEQRDLLSQARGFLNFGVDLAGLLVPLWVFIVGALGFIMFVSKNKTTRNVLFVVLVVILFLVFSFEFLNLFGVAL